jgi:hypothetical protein
MSPWPEDWILYARKSDITKWVKSDIRILQFNNGWLMLTNGIYVNYYVKSLGIDTLSSDR